MRAILPIRRGAEESASRLTPRRDTGVDVDVSEECVSGNPDGNGV